MITREQIKQMKAGKEINALVAEYIMGWIVMEDKDVGIPDQSGLSAYQAIPLYSSDWNMAGKVIEEMGKNHFISITNASMRDISLDHWFCRMDKGKHIYESMAAIVPLAICKTALLAVMEYGE